MYKEIIVKKILMINFGIKCKNIIVGMHHFYFII